MTPGCRSLFRRDDFDLVVHLAAENHVDRSIVSSATFVRTNVAGTHALLECALAAWKSSMAGRQQSAAACTEARAAG